MVNGRKRNSPEYCCIAPLRGLELRRNNPVMWRRLNLLMDHEEERNNEPEFQEMFQVNIINFLRKVCGLEEYEESEIFRIIGIIRTNALQVRINILFNAKTKFQNSEIINLKLFNYSIKPLSKILLVL
jgi:hypothetical protein